MSSRAHPDDFPPMPSLNSADVQGRAIIVSPSEHLKMVLQIYKHRPLHWIPCERPGDQQMRSDPVRELEVRSASRKHAHKTRFPQRFGSMCCVPLWPFGSLCARAGDRDSPLIDHNPDDPTAALCLAKPGGFTGTKDCTRMPSVRHFPPGWATTHSKKGKRPG